MSKRFDLDGKVAVVTGAASGIGQAIARSLAKRGCNVALADLNENGLEQTAHLIGNSVRVTSHTLDVADADAGRGLHRPRQGGARPCRCRREQRRTRDMRRLTVDT